MTGSRYQRPGPEQILDTGARCAADPEPGRHLSGHRQRAGCGRGLRQRHGAAADPGHRLQLIRARGGSLQEISLERKESKMYNKRIRHKTF